MNTLPEGITQTELDEYAKLDAAIKKAMEKKNALNVRIKAAFVKKGTFVFNSIVIKIGEQKRLDRTALEKAYPFEKYPQYYVSKPVLNEEVVADKIVAKFTNTVPVLSISIAN